MKSIIKFDNITLADGFAHALNVANETSDVQPFSTVSVSSLEGLVDGQSDPVVFVTTICQDRGPTLINQHAAVHGGVDVTSEFSAILS